MASRSVETLLRHTKLDESIAPEHLIVDILYTTPIETALKILATHHLLAAPIKDSTREASAYKGFVDVFDLVHYAVAKIYSKPENARGLLGVHEDQLKHSTHNAFHDPVSQAVDFSSRDPMHTVSYGTSLLAIAMLFGSGIHRVLVANAGGTIRAIFSQSALLRHIHTHMRSLDLTTLVGELWPEGTLPKTATILQSADMFDAFRQMVAHKVSCIGIVDSENRLVANLSASDLRGITRENFSFLGGSIMKFLTRNSPTPKPPVMCTLQTPLEQVIDQALSQKVHHIYVVDAENKPLGVLSYTTLIQKLIA